MSKRAVGKHGVSSKRPDYVKTMSPTYGGVSVSFDLLQAPVPERMYCPEYCDITESPNGNFLFLFSDFNATTNKPNHTLIVTFSDIAMISFWHNSHRFLNDLRAHAKKIYPDLKIDGEPNYQGGIATQSLAANMMMMARSDGDVDISFYNFSPRSARLTAQGRPSREEWVEPVVEIKATLRVALPMLVKVEKIVMGIADKNPELKSMLDAKMKLLEEI